MQMDRGGMCTYTLWVYDVLVVGCKLLRLFIVLSTEICFCWLGKGSVGLVSGLTERPESFPGRRSKSAEAVIQWWTLSLDFEVES